MISNNNITLPDGYLAIPLTETHAAAALRVCLLVRLEPDPVGGNLVLLRENSLARIFLACILDAKGNVLQFLELWIQNLEKNSPIGLSNQEISRDALDQRWLDTLQALRSLRTGVLNLGFEETHPPKIYFDLDARFPIHGEPSEGQNTLAVNPDSAMMLARPYYSIDVEEFLSTLNEGVWRGISHGQSDLDLPDASFALRRGGIKDFEDELFFGTRSQSERSLEIFYLKLKMLTGMVEEVKDFISSQNRPLCDLGPDSFRFEFSSPGSGLPVLWTGRPLLVGPGVAANYSLAQRNYCFVLDSHRRSVFSQDFISPPDPLIGEIRIRDVIERGSELVLSGTLVTNEILRVCEYDLICFKLTLGDKVSLFHAHPDESSALTSGECRFETLPEVFPTEFKEVLLKTAGMTFSKVEFQELPVVDPSRDIYSLGVLGTLIFLTNKNNGLPVALDEVMSFAREIASEHDDSKTLAERVEKVFKSDPRWLSALGLDKLMDSDSNHLEISYAIPETLWFEFLALIVTLFPTVGPDSLCQDWHAAREGHEKFFDQALLSLNKTLRRVRELMFSNSKANKESLELITQIKRTLEI